METTIQPGNAGHVESLHFTDGSGSGINKTTPNAGTLGAGEFEQIDRVCPMVNDSTPAKSGVGQVNSVRLYLEAITADGLPREIRMIHATRKDKTKIQSRLLDLKETSIQEVIDFLAESEEMGFNAYITVNPLKSKTKIDEFKAASDADIRHRAFIPIDVDPIRTSKTLATEAQREAAKAVADAVLKWYAAIWPGYARAVVGCSGSGWQILLPCFIPATTEGDEVIKRLLTVLADTFSTDAAKIDQTVKNRSRIMRILGTLAIYADGQRHGWLESGPTPDELNHVKKVDKDSIDREIRMLEHGLSEVKAGNISQDRFIESSTAKPTAAATGKTNGKAHGIPILTLGGATIEKRIWSYIRPILSDIATAPDQAKHETLFKKTAKIANYAAGADLEGYGTDFTKAIEDALASNPSKVADWKAARKTIADAWKKGIGEPEKLKDRPLAASVESNGRADHDQGEPGTTATGGSRDNRPIILIPLERNNPAELLDKLTPHLARAGIYQRDGGLCRIVQSGESKVKGIGRKAAGGPVVDPHDVHSITPAIGKTVSFYVERVSKSGEIYTVATEPPGKLMQQLLRLKNWPETPLLVGITRAPFMRPDGTICTEPGYDRETGWYLDYTGRPVVVPDKPTRATAEDAARTLLSLIDDFEFLGESHRAAFLTYLLTLVARPGIEGHCPAHVFTANTPGSGKTLLVDVANLIAFGQAPPGYQAPQNAENPDEWRKLLFSFAQTGSLSLVVSNYPSGQAIGNAALDMVLTEHRIIDRVLGKSETRESAWVAAVAITGNNLGSSADFVFRSIWSVLESSEENPRQRTDFKIADLRGFVLEHRHNLLRKALTILAWHAGEGFPSAGGQHYGSFEEWAKVVRDAVMHLTGHDVLKNNEAAGVADVEADELTQLLTGFKVYSNWKQSERITAGDIYDDITDVINASSFGELRSLVDTGRGKRSFESSFGRLVNKHKGRVKNLGTDEQPERVKIVIKTYLKKKYVFLETVHPKKQ